MKKFTFGLVLLAFVAVSVNGHQWKTGECPPVEPMSGFDMKKVSNLLNQIAAVAFRYVFGYETQCSSS